MKDVFQILIVFFTPIFKNILVWNFSFKRISEICFGNKRLRNE